MSASSTAIKMTINGKQQSTVYIQPGSRSCKVYLIPRTMRRQESPQSIPFEDQSDWELVGLLDCELNVVWLSPGVHHLKNDIAGAHPGTYFDTEIQ